MDISHSNYIHNPATTHTLDEPRKNLVSRIKGIVTRHAEKSDKEHHLRRLHTSQMTRTFGLTVAQRTDVGLKREHNEDSVAYIIPKDEHILASKGALFIVADGMGGHAAGEVASEIAVNTVCTLYYQDPDSNVGTCLERSIKYANAAIYQRATENASHSGMGTTCVVAVLRGKVVYIANVGDSRAYIVHRGKVRQISHDHSWVAEQVRLGNLTRQEARVHAMRNIITRSLGPYPEVEVDTFAEPMEEGDALILCSDGLCGMISDRDILHIVEKFGPQECVYRLVERANALGGIDNITAIVARVTAR